MKEYFGNNDEGLNVYRTNKYIVFQEISILDNDSEGNYIISHDTYYLRTKKRDAEYECAFATRKRINGRRLPTSLYTRVYID